MRAPQPFWKPVLEGIDGAGRIAAAMLTPFLRSRRVRWGATDAEVARKLPGDDHVPTPKWTATHAITILAPADEVWSWLVQIGQGRGGFYSYEWLENLIGCNMHNAEHILPEYQSLHTGDTIRLHPAMPGLPAEVQPRRAIVLHGDSRAAALGNSPIRIGHDWMNMTWTFFVEPLGEGTTRLIARSRYDYSATIKMKLINGPLLMEPIVFVMERKMLMGLKQRAEYAYWYEEALARAAT